MRIYSSENQHLFTERLYQRINAYGIGNLAMDENRDFTAVIEAVEYDSNETIDLSVVFSRNEINARLILANQLQIPFFIIATQNRIFNIYEVVSLPNGYNFDLREQFDEAQFVSWWLEIKRTHQTHGLNNGAEERVENSFLHQVLSRNGLRWGGNIDGIIIRNNEIISVIDNISIAFRPLNHYEADPARFFFKRGPRYETWLSTVKLASELNVPHLLFTLDKNNPNREAVGITAIERLTPSGIFYKDDIRPYSNIVDGLDAIQSYVSSIIENLEPPTFV
jgi:hypothetical protein